MSENNIELDKRELRKNILKKRNAIYPADLMKKSELISRCIEMESRFLRAKNVLLYYSFGSEVKTDYLLKKSLEMGKRVYYPKVTGDDMDFYRVYSAGEFTSGFKGIMEPNEAGELFGLDSMDKSIIIVPGTVFGRNGYRIGYGRGFYDRYLRRYKDIYKVGVCFSCQLIDNCPYDNLDVRLDEIVTDSEILTADEKGEVRWI